MNLSACHVANNFNIFGFGTEDSALIQSTKELLENSIDACKANGGSPTHGSVNIIFSTTSDFEGNVSLTVSDNGIGMSDPKKFLGCFESSKSSCDASSFTTGRFGIGLSTCLLYSLTKTTANMRIITKVQGGTEATTTAFKLSGKGEPQVVQTRSGEAASFPCGTKITMHLPMKDMSILHGVIHAIDTVLRRFQTLPTTFINTTFKVDVGTIVFEAAYPSWHPSVARFVLHSPDTYRDRLMERLSQQLSAQNKYCYESAVHILEEGIFNVAVGVVLVRNANKATSRSSLHNEDHSNPHSEDSGDEDAHPIHPSPLSMEPNTIPLQLLRFANGVPLLDYRDDAMGCAISTALRAVSWATYGHRLKLSLESDSKRKKKVLQPSVTSSSSNSSAVNAAQGQQNAQNPSSIVDHAAPSSPDDIIRPPRWQLESLYDEERVLPHARRNDRDQEEEQQQTQAVGREGDEDQTLEMLVTVDVHSNRMPFANMRKTCLSGDNAQLLEVVAQGVKECLGQLQKSELTRGVFMNKREHKKSKIPSAYIPSVAASVAKLITLSENTTLKTKWFGILGLTCNNNNADGGEGGVVDPSEPQIRVIIENRIQALYKEHLALKEQRVSRSTRGGGGNGKGRRSRKTHREAEEEEDEDEENDD